MTDWSNDKDDDRALKVVEGPPPSTIPPPPTKQRRCCSQVIGTISELLSRSYQMLRESSKANPLPGGTRQGGQPNQD